MNPRNHVKATPSRRDFLAALGLRALNPSLILFSGLLLAVSVQSRAATIPATSCAQADVQAAVNAARAGDPVRLNLLPDHSASELLAANRAGGRDVRTALRQMLPERFVQAWGARHAPVRPIAQWSPAELENVAQNLHAWEITPAGDKGYPKTEVTVGGVDTGELSSKTLECRQVPGLYFIGEVVDVTGWLGGYNFPWAWASGHAAGQAV